MSQENHKGLIKLLFNRPRDGGFFLIFSSTLSLVLLIGTLQALVYWAVGVSLILIGSLSQSFAVHLLSLSVSMGAVHGPVYPS